MFKSQVRHEPMRICFPFWQPLVESPLAVLKLLGVQHEGRWREWAEARGAEGPAALFGP